MSYQEYQDFNFRLTVYNYLHRILYRIEFCETKLKMIWREGYINVITMHNYIIIILYLFNCC